jgi:hypothetical protein
MVLNPNRASPAICAPTARGRSSLRQPQVARVVQEPYNLGQAIYNGTYKFKKPAGTHVAEKTLRLTTSAARAAGSRSGKNQSKNAVESVERRE